MEHRRNGAGRRFGAGLALAEDELPPAQEPTGQYPGPLWAEGAAFALEAEDELPPAEEPTGQYPGPVWADAAAFALEAEDELPPAEEPTGVYPGPVWADAAAWAHPASSDAPPSPPAPSADAAPPAPAVSVSPVSADDAPRAEDRRKEDAYSEELAVSAAQADDALPAALTLPEMYRVVRAAAEADSGDELYAAVLADADHAARHGLAWGLALFTQGSGRLGSVLRLTQQRDAALFDRLFGSDSLALLQVTNADTPAARLAPVSGVALTDPSWVERFRAAGAEEACRNAQNEEAIARQMRPLARFALALGLDTDRGLAMAYDRAVVAGLGGGVRWLVESAGLLRTPSQLQTALQIIGSPDLRSFQESTGWVSPTGEGNAETVCALLEALRRRDALPLPTSAEVQARLVAAARGGARRRLLRILRSDKLTDQPYR